MYIDTHVHLNSNNLYIRLNDVINAAFNNNVKKFIVVGYNLETSKKAIELSEKYECCYAAIGFHPTEIKGYGEDEYAWLEKASSHPKVVAIGEVGYDFHWDTTTKEEQAEAFKRQIKIAIKHNLPLIIHSRDAMQLTYDTLKQENAQKVGGVIHSYSGSSEMAKEFIKIDFRLGISGPVTFKNGKTMKDVVSKIDLKYLLTETDSPYLAPHPFRGQENEPKNIAIIVEEIAKIKNISVETIEKTMEENVKNLFGV